ncbi:Ankyrin-1 [Dactylellina cionopaga]|nr:Ankyrin-1 [Dactylellina cionopaga]
MVPFGDHDITSKGSSANTTFHRGRDSRNIPEHYSENIPPSLKSLLVGQWRERKSHAGYDIQEKSMLLETVIGKSYAKQYPDIFSERVNPIEKWKQENSKLTSLYIGGREKFREVYASDAVELQSPEFISSSASSCPTSGFNILHNLVVNSKDPEDFRLKVGCFPELVNKPGGRLGSTPLHTAIQCGNTEFAMILIQEAGADISTLIECAEDKSIKLNALHFAISKQNVQLTQLILDMVATQYPKLWWEREYGTLNGGTIAHLAADDSADCLALILDRQPDLAKTQNSREETPLHIAVQRGDFASLFELLCCKVDVNAVDIQGITPLHIAYSFERAPEGPSARGEWADDQKKGKMANYNRIYGTTMVETLLKNGANPEMLDCTGLSPGDYTSTSLDRRSSSDRYGFQVASMGLINGLASGWKLKGAVR